MADHYLYRPFLYTLLIFAPILMEPVQATAMADTNSSVREPSDDKKISVQRAKEILKKLPQGDPWEKTRDASALSWGEAPTLQALVDLYEATRDKQYLLELISRGDRLLGHRDDKRGVADGSGKIRPAWSMGSKYVAANGKLLDEGGTPFIELRSTPSSNNNLTSIKVILADKPSRFSLAVTNEFYKRNETFSDLSLDPADDRYVEKIVNDPLSPYSARAGDYTEKSNLIRVIKVNGKAKPAAQTIQLTSIPLAYMGYLGIIYDPLMRFAEIVKKDPKLARMLPAADRFIQAAEESYRDASPQTLEKRSGKRRRILPDRRKG